MAEARGIVSGRATVKPQTLADGMQTHEAHLPEMMQAQAQQSAFRLIDHGSGESGGGTGGVDAAQQISPCADDEPFVMLRKILDHPHVEADAAERAGDLGFLRQWGWPGLDPRPPGE